MTLPALTHLVRSGSVVLLDGATGTELQRRGADTGLPLWSAQALDANPEMVVQIHREYVAAGADIITANTFRTTPRTFHRAGIPDRSAELSGRAVTFARQAAQECTSRAILVAGSIAPLEDCYRPDLVPDEAALRAEHTHQAELLASFNVDFLLLETMGTIREAAIAAACAAAAGMEFVVSFLCTEEGMLYGGESLAAAVGAVLPSGPAALAVNCLPVRSALPVLRRLRSLSNLPPGVYANAGVPGTERTHTMHWDVTPAIYAAEARTWMQEGAVIVGGCCGTTPDHIRAMERSRNAA